MTDPDRAAPAGPGDGCAPASPPSPIPHPAPLAGLRVIEVSAFVAAPLGGLALVVHGPLIAVLLAELLRQYTTRPLRDFRFRAVAPLFAPHPFRLIARPDALGADQPVPLTAEGPDGTIAMQAEAVFQS